MTANGQDPVFLRIDDRLVHGQVVEGWLPVLKPDVLLVVSAGAASDPVQQALMALSVPEPVELRFCRPDEGAALAAALAKAGKRTLILVPGPREALQLVEGGLKVARVNVGGLHYSAGRVQVGKAIFLSDEDKRALRALWERGIALEGRAVPAEAPSDVAPLVKH